MKSLFFLLSLAFGHMALLGPPSLDSMDNDFPMASFLQPYDQKEAFKRASDSKMNKYFQAMSAPMDTMFNRKWAYSLTST